MKNRLHTFLRLSLAAVIFAASPLYAEDEHQHGHADDAASQGMDHDTHGKANGSSKNNMMLVKTSFT